MIWQERAIDATVAIVAIVVGGQLAANGDLRLAIGLPGVIFFGYQIFSLMRRLTEIDAGAAAAQPWQEPDLWMYEVRWNDPDEDKG